MNKYYEEANRFRIKILEYLSIIFKVYGNELELKIEEINLLKEVDNCIESSTAIGFLLEEFVYSKLKIYTKNHEEDNDDYKILRNKISTTDSSYDFYSILKDSSKCLINLKVEKNNNNAIAAITKLHKDYVLTEPNQIKHYLIIKIGYSVGDTFSQKRKVLIKKVKGYFLEEVDLSLGIKQDHRNWSEILNFNSGRLIITEKDFINKKIEENSISYQKTRDDLGLIFSENQKK